MLDALVVETFQRTDAAGSRRGARVRWVPDAPDVEVVIAWHHRADPAPWGDWDQREGLRGWLFEIFPALPGRYEFRVYGQAPGRSVVWEGDFELDVPPLLESELELPRPSGVELVGPSGELLGSAREFVGRDLRVRWNAVRLDALETDGIGEAPQDELLEQLELRVVGPAGETLRTVRLPINASEWTYTYAQNTEDQPLALDAASALRTVRLELRWQDRLGRLGPPAVLEVEHTLQLAATEDIETSAVSAITVVEDISEDTTGVSAVHATYTLLEEIELEGLGYPVSVQFTDRIFWGLAGSASGVAPYVTLRYRLRVIDEADVVAAEVEKRVVEWWGWDQLFGDVFMHPDLTVRAQLELGVTYRVQVHVFWKRETVDSGSLDMGSTSYERRFVVTDLKR